jgi:hypothetical protein
MPLDATLISRIKTGLDASEYLRGAEQVAGANHAR